LTYLYGYNSFKRRCAYTLMGYVVTEGVAGRSREIYRKVYKLLFFQELTVRKAGSRRCLTHLGQRR
jgi:hypothetical protein